MDGYCDTIGATGPMYSGVECQGSRCQVMIAKVPDEFPFLEGGLERM